jgi:hypothetical protein
MPALMPTSLESALLSEFHRLYQGDGFPDLEHLSVASRENTGGGRYVTLHCSTDCSMHDGYLDLGGKYIKMVDILNGMMAVVLVSGGSPTMLEITVYGDDFWDGQERQWAIQ